MRKYVYLIQSTIVTQLRSPTSLLMRLILLILMISIFNQFWQILKAHNSSGILIEPVNFLWYLLLGSLLQFSKPEGLHKQIEDDIKTGNIAYQMTRPVSVIMAYFLESLATFIIRMPFLLVCGGLWITLVTQKTPAFIEMLPLILFLLFLSAIFISLMTVFIGLSTFFLHDSMPLFWVIQKCEYTFGGLFFPLIFYPEWLYKLALYTPFGWIGYGVTHLIYDFSTLEVYNSTLHICFWIIILFIFIQTLYMLLKRKVAVYGG